MKSNIERRILVTDSGCWEWTKNIDLWGYGKFRAKMAHRLSYETFVGPIPDGLVIDHLCSNPPCVNPDHLEPVTVAENNRRGRGFAGEKFRQTHCIHGHEFSPENTYIRTNGTRKCKTCKRDLQREYEREAYHVKNPQARRYARRAWSDAEKRLQAEAPPRSTPARQGTY